MAKLCEQYKLPPNKRVVLTAELIAELNSMELPMNRHGLTNLTCLFNGRSNMDTAKFLVPRMCLENGLPISESRKRKTNLRMIRWRNLMILGSYGLEGDATNDNCAAL